MAEPHAHFDPAQLLQREIAAGTLELPVLSSVAAEVLQLSTSSSGDAAELAALIQRDQALASNLLRVVNSPAYRGATEIVALQQAIARLGMTLIREVVLAVSMASALKRPGPFDAPVQAAWRQALATALWSRELARCSRKNVENAYLCGLLHNIGEPVILHRLTALSVDVTQTQPVSAEQAKQLTERFASAAGMMLVRAWKLPELAAICIEHVDRFVDAADQADLVAIVATGRDLATAQINGAALPLEQVQQWPSITHLHLYPDTVTELLEHLPRIAEQLQALGVSPT